MNKTEQILKELRIKLAEAMIYMTEASAKGIGGKQFANEIVDKRNAVIELFEASLQRVREEVFETCGCSKCRSWLNFENIIEEEKLKESK